MRGDSTIQARSAEIADKCAAILGFWAPAPSMEERDRWANPDLLPVPSNLEQSQVPNQLRTILERPAEVPAPPPTIEWRSAPYPPTYPPTARGGLLRNAHPGNVLQPGNVLEPVSEARSNVLDVLRSSPGGIKRFSRRMKPKDPLPPLDKSTLSKIQKDSEVNKQSTTPSQSSSNLRVDHDPHFAFRVQLEAKQRRSVEPKPPRLNPKLERQVKQGDLNALGLILCSCFGTLEAAFRQFDGANSGRVAMYAWLAGLERIGINSRTAIILFKALETDTHHYLVVEDLIFGCAVEGKRRKGNSWLRRLSLRGSGLQDANESSNILKFQKASAFSPGRKSTASGPVRSSIIGDGDANILLQDPFAAEVRKKLAEMGGLESMEFPKGLTSHQRTVVHAVARAAKMWSNSQGEGAERQIVVFNLKDFEQHTRHVLRNLPEGKVEEFPVTLTKVQRQVVHLVANELGLWALSETIDGQRRVFVADFQQFAVEVRKELLKLPEGQFHAFPANYSIAQRQVVHIVAHGLGFCSGSEDLGASKSGSRAGRRVVVYNLLDFASEIRKELLALPDGTVKVFPASLNANQRKMVHMVASELGLKSHGQGEGYNRHVVVGDSLTELNQAKRLRSGTEDLSDNGSDGEASDVSDASASSEIDARYLSEREHTERLFGVYAKKGRMHWGQFLSFLEDHDLYDNGRAKWMALFQECEQIETQINHGRGLDTPAGGGVSLEYFKLCLHMGALGKGSALD